jgi:hypothetical protein
MRATFADISDTRDVRLSGLGLVGLKLYGTPPRAPGIIICGS